MKIIETPWHLLGKFIGLGFGIPFFLVGLIWLFYGGNVAILYNGILWIVVSFLLLIKAKLNNNKLKKLKKEGVCYDCFITEIIPNNMVRIGSYMTARIKCKYKDEKSEKSVVSGYYLLSPWDRIENLNAKIYIDKNTNTRNIVIISRNKEIFKT